MSNKTRALSKEQIDNILKLQLSKKEIFVVKFLLYTGLRVSDFIDLRFNNFDFSQKTTKIKMQKTKRIVEITNTQRLQELIKDWQEYSCLKDKDFLLRSPVSIHKQTRQSITFLLDKIEKKYKDAYGEDVSISPHALRKTVAVRLYKETNDLEIVRRLLGHTSIANTQKYLTSDELDQKFEDVMKAMEW